MKNNLTDDDIKKFCRKYNLDVFDCINNMKRINNIAKDIDSYVCTKEIKILKSVEELSSMELEKCVK